MKLMVCLAPNPNCVRSATPAATMGQTMPEIVAFPEARK